jgi:hypothetical protein
LLVTSERSPLEPQTEQKYYARGLGEIEERVVQGITRVSTGQRDVLIAGSSVGPLGVRLG